MKRSITVGLQKPEDSADPRPPIDYESIIRTVAQESTKLVAGYILLDTIRQVAVARASR